MVLNGVMAVSDEIIISSVHIKFEWNNAHFFMPWHFTHKTQNFFKTWFK